MREDGVRQHGAVLVGLVLLLAGCGGGEGAAPARAVAAGPSPASASGPGSDSQRRALALAPSVPDVQCGQPPGDAGPGSPTPNATELPDEGGAASGSGAASGGGAGLALPGGPGNPFVPPAGGDGGTGLASSEEGFRLGKVRTSGNLQYGIGHFRWSWGIAGLSIQPGGKVDPGLTSVIQTISGSSVDNPGGSGPITWRTGSWAYRELFRGDKVRIDQIASTEASLDCGSHGYVSQGGSVYIAWPADTSNPKPDDTWIDPVPDGIGIKYDDTGYMEACTHYAAGWIFGPSKSCTRTQPYPKALHPLFGTPLPYHPKFSLTAYNKVAKYSATVKWKIHRDMAPANSTPPSATCEVKWEFNLPDPGSPGGVRKYEATATTSCSKGSTHMLALPGIPGTP